MDELEWLERVFEVDNGGKAGLEVDEEVYEGDV